MADPTIVKEESPAPDRRAFLRAAAWVAGGVTLAAMGVITAADLSLRPGAARAAGDSEDWKVRMQRDLQRALTKPMEKRSWVMVIDSRKCIGCNACTVACIAENNLPPGVSYRTVYDVTFGEYPDLWRFLKPTNCFQCAKPPCMTAANKVIPGSMGIRPDGIVTIDYTKMKGRKVFEAAKKACPYKYALYYDTGGYFTNGTPASHLVAEAARSDAIAAGGYRTNGKPAVQAYERRLSLEYGRTVSREETAGVTRKCHFCIQRIERGVLPACVATCTGQAMHFGDRNDQTSLVSTLLAEKPHTFVVEQAKGTSPRVIYLADNPTNEDFSCAHCHKGGNLKGGKVL